MKRYSTECKKEFENFIDNKELIPKIYKVLTQPVFFFFNPNKTSAEKVNSHVSKEDLQMINR